MIFYFHALHFDKSIILLSFVLATFGFLLLYFFYTSSNTVKFLISSFILLYSFKTLFIKTNSAGLITESIKALEIKTYILFNSDFANNAILSRFFVFFLIIDLYFLIPAVIAQVFNPIAELANSIGMRVKQKWKHTQ